mmetsp:Transcript_25596/g.58896  ORF Transcript_25596/g.58896 Transcript_25596/m.58896 type:complete len:116 (+) Transcript_25596:2-349(+)
MADAEGSGEVPNIEDAEKVVCASKFPKFPKVEAGKTYYWCTCGKSKGQPWCDGSHVGTAHLPKEWKAEKTGTVKMCMCKSTGTPPICDNTHIKLISPCCGGPSVKVGEAYTRIKH